MNRWVQGATLPFEVTGSSAVSISPSGKYTLVFKEEEATAAGAGAIVRTYDVTTFVWWCITSHTTKPHPKPIHTNAKPHTQGGEKKVLAEVWSATALLKTLQLGHAHGPVMGDAWFGALTWCESV
jgi:hypothetical protein